MAVTALGALAALMFVVSRDPTGPRGWAQPTLTCPKPNEADWAPPNIVDRDDPEALPDDVSAFVLCPRPLPWDETAGSPVVVASGSARFNELETLISAEDEPLPRGYSCTAVSEDSRVLWARVGSRVFLVHLPTDACGHYRSELESLLDEILPRSETPSPTPS
ncbi:hypothetical protein GCM10020369_22990 [Cryptosporangium minutisporangium]|uniref:Secreted protein n=2 Tax=Cryptosporangium minutisporangium TaxID=113569 RepID=A0ABP6SVR4_9ACTN